MQARSRTDAGGVGGGGGVGCGDVGYGAFVTRRTCVAARGGEAWEQAVVLGGEGGGNGWDDDGGDREQEVGSFS